MARKDCTSNDLDSMARQQWLEHYIYSCTASSVFPYDYYGTFCSRRWIQMHRTAKYHWYELVGLVSISANYPPSSMLTVFRLVSLALFRVTCKIDDPFRAHLYGVTKEEALLPLILPYKTSMQRPMFSEMSFKCRSSTSLSSHTLVPSFDSTSSLLPSKPDKVVGLGIYAPKKTTAAFLAPRPSLSSIRTHTTIGARPPSSPLPPLPAYFPAKYRKGSAMHKAIYPPKRPQRPERSKSERTVRIVPPSPALSAANLDMHNNSVESLSSVYSRSTSGEKHSPRPIQRPVQLTDGSRSYSSGSTATIIKSPLGAMRLADRPDIVLVGKSSRVSSASSTDTEIDDVATLQAKLPSVKAVSDFGDVQTWDRSSRPLNDVQNDGGDQFKEDPTQRARLPLLVRKTRDSGSMFQCSSIKALA